MNNILSEDSNFETIVLGGGCFWCTEAVFKMLKGIISVEPGYAGGHTDDPIYEEVLSGTTGHAEVIKIVYDPKAISFDDMLTVFFATHNPTTENRQGNDIGEQYRSIILCTSQKQKQSAKDFISNINISNEKGKPVVTEVRDLGEFFPAESPHKNYYKNHPEQTYCKVVINPKLDKVREKFAHLLKTF